MQNTSEGYNPFSDERWSRLRVVFELVDVEAAEDAIPLATGEAEISRLSQTHNRTMEMSNKLATLEQNQFVLDSSYNLPDKENGEVGWWSSQMSGSNGVFETPQILEFCFTADRSSVGFMILFDDMANEYATDFIIQVFDSEDLLLSEDAVMENKAHAYISEMPVMGYRKVRITFTRTSKAYRRLRVCEVVFGVIHVFDESNTTNARILYEISPSGEHLPSGELALTIENVDKKYNMINPKGIYKYLEQGQYLSAELGVGATKETIERVNMGRFFFTSSSAEDSAMTTQIIAHDWFYRLDRSICRIGSTGTWLLWEAVTEVVADCGIPINISIPPDIGARIVNRCIPQNTSYREAIRLIAQAGMCNCYFNRDGVLVFADLTESEPVDTLDNSNLNKPAKVKVTDHVNKVEITVRDEYAGTETIYTASSKEPDETDQIMTVKNPLVASSEVAGWLLSIHQKRIRYDLSERGNPAREIGDTVKIFDAYFENRNAIITKEEYLFDGVLKANTTAWGGI